MEPTKVVESLYRYEDDGSEKVATHETYEFLCSVELGETAKGEAQVKSVKVYAATVKEAGDCKL